MSPVHRAPRELTSTESALRVEYLHDVLDLLWPDPAAAVVGRGRDDVPVTSEFVVVPSLSRPRLLVPLGSPPAAATAVRRYSEPASRWARLRLEALALAMSTGVGPLLMRDRVRIAVGSDESDSIERYLSDALGTELRVSLHIGPARANRKPVLQLLSRQGEVIGFVKVGVNDLTRRLVAAEGESLSQLAAARFSHTQVPGVLHTGMWRDLAVLVQSPLPIWRRRTALTPTRLVDSMLEVATSHGTRSERLTSSAFWSDLTAGLGHLESTATVEQLRSAFATLTDHARHIEVPMGAWHGDWTPWNMASVADRLLVWDWERFQHGVPLGFDALHFELQAAVVGRLADARLAVAGCLSRAPELLAPFGIARADAEVVALTYLVTLATRYLQDGQAEAGARLGVLGQWLLPELVDKVAAL